MRKRQYLPYRARRTESQCICCLKPRDNENIVCSACERDMKTDRGLGKSWDRMEAYIVSMDIPFYRRPADE